MVTSIGVIQLRIHRAPGLNRKYIYYLLEISKNNGSYVRGGPQVSFSCMIIPIVREGGG